MSYIPSYFLSRASPCASKLDSQVEGSIDILWSVLEKLALASFKLIFLEHGLIAFNN